MAGHTRRPYPVQRLTLVASLALVAVAAWAWLIDMASGMSGMGAAFMPWPTLVMWTAMMVAMMLPSAAPAILVFAAATRRSPSWPAVLPYLFATGYLLAWTSFAGLATLTQWGLNEAALLSPGQSLGTTTWAGMLLLGAGLFQWTRLKDACLRSCRSPMGLVAQGLPLTPPRALGTGLRLGLFCTGCCWALMALMFVGGVMSLAWMAGLTLLILLEKLIPYPRRLSRCVGTGLIAYGGWLALG
ncbi:DUF2182 domain-containing protein [Halomonas organivorans]|uniref:Putative metal-binding membrane protein n=1 Tax=Halomonas organivorans TaxID=257772 RepID=A0A7W5G4C3_9GAMM|nr:DUF2182 domain-containing protein [Halomonas organivorans]MBB3139790.1 putative metal-binding membrane protein [Halomonas organivorans]